MKEEWRDIKDYEGLYQISNFGNVKSLNYKHSQKERILRNNPSSNGYINVRLFKDGEFKRFWVHRLVALAFLSNPNNYPCINHIDSNKQNNNVNNLEWCSYSYNIKYGYDNGYHKPITKTSQSRVIKQYDLQGNLINIYETYKGMCRQLFGKQKTGILKCCANDLFKYTAYGYRWQYGTMEEYINFHKGARENEI